MEKGQTQAPGMGHRPEGHKTEQASSASRRSSGRPRRVLLSGPLPPPYTGYSIAFASLVQALCDEPSWQVTVVSTGNQDWQPNQWGLRRLWRTVRIFLKTICLLPLTQLFYLTPAQSTAGFLRDAGLILVARLLRRRIVAHLHGGAFHRLYQETGPLFSRFLSGTVRQTDLFLVLSDSLQEKFSVVPGLRGRMRVVPNGVETPPDVVAKWLPEQGPLHLLFLTNLMFEKGYADLLEAARLLRTTHPRLDLRYQFAGAFFLDAGHYPSLEVARADFWRRVREGGVGDRVTYHGVVSGQAKKDLLQGSHLLALPTYYRYEGQPLSVLEAMAHALPVVATSWAALPEMVTDGETGYLVPPRDPAMLAAAIVRVVEDPKRYARLSAAALARAQGEYSLERHLERMTASFRAALV